MKIFLMCCGTVVNARQRLTRKTRNLNKVVIFVFFAHKKYSHSFITLQFNHCCHMDYFINVLTTYLGLERVSCMAVNARSESSRISSKFLFED